ncbi:MAG: DUF4870 domain-containing protein, partial [Gammaproteobacteria bacterium]
SEAEFQAEKDRLLRSREMEFRPWGMDVKSYCMMLHLSQLASFLVPFAGIALPVVMWLVYKDESPEIDAHGRVVTNWIISALIYTVVGFLLALIFIGFLLLLALFIVNIVFVIMGAIKANEGTVWPYPLSINFLSPPPAEQA